MQLNKWDRICLRAFTRLSVCIYVRTMHFCARMYHVIRRKQEKTWPDFVNADKRRDSHKTPLVPCPFFPHLPPPPSYGATLGPSAAAAPPPRPWCSLLHTWRLQKPRCCQPWMQWPATPYSSSLPSLSPCSSPLPLSGTGVVRGTTMARQARRRYRCSATSTCSASRYTTR